MNILMQYNQFCTINTSTNINSYKYKQVSNPLEVREFVAVAH